MPSGFLLEDSLGIPEGFLRDPSGIPKGFPEDSLGIPFGFRRTLMDASGIYGDSLGFP